MSRLAINNVRKERAKKNGGYYKYTTCCPNCNSTLCFFFECELPEDTDWLAVEITYLIEQEAIELPENTDWIALQLDYLEEEHQEWLDEIAELNDF